MRRLIVCLLVSVLALTSCAYIGATEDILIAAPSSNSAYHSDAFTADESSSLLSDSATDTDSDDASGRSIILNKNSKKIHYYDTCSYAGNIKDENKSIVPYEQFSSLISEGYDVCSWCEKQSEKS